MNPIDVEVLLSTYNGERFLKQQLDSIMAQTYPAWRILIRDDGSTDKTIEILSLNAKQDPRIQFLLNDIGHRGACRSFASLIQHATTPYSMFCDQDDIWYPEKIQTMMSAMHKAEEKFPSAPLLIVADLNVIDEDQRMIAPSFWKYQGLSPQTGSSFASLVIRNKFPGCSMLLNQTLREIVLDIPEQAVMHDWWIAMAAAAFGHIIIIPRPLTYYRQHQSNTIGISRDHKLSKNLFSIARSMYGIVTRRPIVMNKLNQLTELPEIATSKAFRERYAHKLTQQQMALLDSLNRYSLIGIFRYRIFRQPPASNIKLLLVLLFLKVKRLRAHREEPSGGRHAR
ncbi:MAG: glycosyltransferase family 2 protein [Syntrophaceae bacterium]